MPRKTNCQLLCESTGSTQAAASKLARTSASQVCDQHPSFTLALDALNMYERWVSRVVLPIAFEWIGEHPEICDGIPDSSKDDIGVVIAAAFEKVQRCPHYLAGQQACSNFKSGKLKAVRPINPVWDRISQGLSAETRRVYQAESKFLINTICP